MVVSIHLSENMLRDKDEQGDDILPQRDAVDDQQGRLTAQDPGDEGDEGGVARLVAFACGTGPGAAYL